MSKTKDIPSAVREEVEKQNNPKLQELHNQVGPSPEQVLPKMEVSRFLEQSQQHRLYLLTGNTNVAEGKILTVDFQNNSTLQREITAGHILPPEVRKITVNGIQGVRNGLRGEFFANNGKGKRLKIFTGTQLSINELSSPEALIEMQNGIEKQANTFSDEQKPLVRTALERGIDPILVVNAKESLGVGYESLADDQRAEMLATVVGRKQGEFQAFQSRLPQGEEKSIISDGKYSPEFIGFVLGNEKETRLVFQKYGYSESQIEAANNYQKQMSNVEKLSSDEFVKQATEFAKKVEAKYGIPWEACLAQACLETGYGKHVVGNNYFGIKGGGGEKVSTREFVNGKWVTIQDSFRGYPNMEASFMAYGEFLSRSPRYRNAFSETNPKDFLQAVINSGYATDPQYVRKAENILGRLGIDFA